VASETFRPDTTDRVVANRKKSIEYLKPNV
jgi:hypothetical protein